MFLSIHHLVICMQSECSLSNGNGSNDGDRDRGSVADEDEDSICPAQLGSVLDSDSGLRFRNCLRVIYANQLPTASALSLSLLCVCSVSALSRFRLHFSINQSINFAAVSSASTAAGSSLMPQCPQPRESASATMPRLPLWGYKI